MHLHGVQCGHSIRWAPYFAVQIHQCVIGHHIGLAPLHLQPNGYLSYRFDAEATAAWVLWLCAHVMLCKLSQLPLLCQMPQGRRRLLKTFMSVQIVQKLTVVCLLNPGNRLLTSTPQDSC